MHNKLHGYCVRCQDFSNLKTLFTYSCTIHHGKYRTPFPFESGGMSAICAWPIIHRSRFGQDVCESRIWKILLSAFRADGCTSWQYIHHINSCCLCLCDILFWQCSVTFCFCCGVLLSKTHDDIANRVIWHVLSIPMFNYWNVFNFWTGYTI